MNIFNAVIVFLVLASNAEACNPNEALKAAREYVLKESPKGSKISLLKKNNEIRYTATLLDEVGTYTGSGKLKISSEKSEKCGVESIESSALNLYNSGSSEMISLRNGTN